MASTNKTANLDLNQWSLSDKPEMADFNADNLKIDTELSAHMAESALDDVHGLTKMVITESVTNGNVRHIKFGDGTLICYNSTPNAILSNTSSRDITFPVPFIDTNYIVIPSQRNMNVNNAILSFNPLTSSTARIHRSASVATQADFVWVAIGRWK